MSNFVLGSNSNENYRGKSQTATQTRKSCETKDVTQFCDMQKSWFRPQHGCFVCGKKEHRKKNCFTFQRRINRAWKKNQCYLEPKNYGRVWIAKANMYSNFKTQTHLEGEIMCNMVRMETHEPENISYVAYTSTETQKRNPWYFYSGRSRHMIGDYHTLRNYSPIKGGSNLWR